MDFQDINLKEMTVEDSKEFSIDFGKTLENMLNKRFGKTNFVIDGLY